jgi:hypothetical protein
LGLLLKDPNLAAELAEELRETMKYTKNLMLTAVGLFIVAAVAPAQQPSPGGTNMQFVPVNTNRNLAAPVPSVPTLQKPVQNKPFLARVGDRIASLNPFRPKQPPAKVPGPLAPTTQLPANQQPSATGTAPSLPQVSPVAQGNIH